MQARVLTAARAAVSSGYFTERQLARLCQISQPQLHNALKGARGLSIASTDALAATLKLSIWDLIDDIDRLHSPPALPMRTQPSPTGSPATATAWDTPASPKRAA